MEQTIITCLNCGNPYEGDFCPSCGQSASTGKFTWNSLLFALLHAFDFERGILFVFRELWIRPRQLLLGYLSGKRTNVYPPFKYMLVSIAITAALNYLYDDLGMKEFVVNGVEHSFDMWTSTNLSIYHIVLLPFYALSTRFFFRKWKLTLPEHIVLAMFALGQMNLTEFIILCVFCWIPGIVSFSTVIAMIIPGYIYFMMCKPRNVGSFFKSISACIVALTMFVLVIIIFTVLFMFITNGDLALHLDLRQTK